MLRKIKVQIDQPLVHAKTEGYFWFDDIYLCFKTWFGEHKTELYFYIRGFAAQLLEKGRKGLNSSMFLSSLWNVKERLDVASPYCTNLVAVLCVP